jgi:hypothetical protein
MADDFVCRCASLIGLPTFPFTVAEATLVHGYAQLDADGLVDCERDFAFGFVQRALRIAAQNQRTSRPELGSIVSIPEGV